MSSSAQVRLAIKNPSGKQKEVFYPSNRLVFKLKKDKTIYNGRIVYLDVKNNKIQIGTESIELSNIRQVYSQKSTRHKSLAAPLFLVGLAYPLIDQFNTVVISNNDFSWNRNVLNASGGFIFSGLFIRLLKRKKYRLKRKFRLVFVF